MKNKQIKNKKRITRKGRNKKNIRKTRKYLRKKGGQTSFKRIVQYRSDLPKKKI